MSRRPIRTAAAALAIASVLPIAPPDDVEAARAGLERIAAAYVDWPPGRPLPECPLLDRALINAALETAGIDSALPSWELEVAPELPGVECAGGNDETSVFLYAGDFGGSASFEQAIEATVAGGGDELTLDADVGPTIGGCVAGLLSTACVEFWERDGFAIGVRVEDLVFLDRPTTASVLVDVVSDVVATLTERATGVADPLSAIDDAVVAAATAGLGSFLDAPVASAGRFDCPALDRATADQALAIDDPLETWDGSTRELSDDAATAVVCDGVAGDTELSVIVADLGDSDAAADFVASVGLAEGGSASDLPPGEATVGACLDAGAQGRFCTEWWWRDGLVVGVWLFGEAEQPPTRDLLVGLVPAVVANLAEL